MIIGLTGTGNRTLVAENICVFDGRFEIRRFEDKLIHVSSIIGNFDPAQYKDYSYRTQRASVIGNVGEVVRNIKHMFTFDHPNIWNESLLDEYQPRNYWIISDVKEVDQALRILDLGGTIYKIRKGKEQGEVWSYDNLLDPYLTDLPSQRASLMASSILANRGIKIDKEIQDLLH